jgi:hypothetical protein
MVFNVSSDLLMLLIPLPFIVGARVPPLKRLLLVFIFSLGAFVILAAVLNKYYNFTMAHTTVYMVWDIRETSTAVYVANVMCWWPLLRKLFGWSAFWRNSSRRSGEDVISINAPSSVLTPVAGDVKMRELGRGRLSSPQWDEEKDGYRNLAG